MIARFPKFDFSNIRAHWTRNPEFAQRLNAASLVPAYVEPYLLKVMMAAREKVDPANTQLLRDIDIFNKQEMQHLKHHLSLNKRIRALGYTRIEPLERKFEADLADFLKNRSLRFNLAYCEGFESMSATACELFFEDYTELLEGADPEPAALWRWHLAEEFEHRTVCSDVYHALSGLNPVSRYFYRVYGYFFAVKHIASLGIAASKALLEHDRETMTPEELEASLKRDAEAKSVMRRRFKKTMLMVISPFYDPAKRRPPIGYQEFLDTMVATRGGTPA